MIQILSFKLDLRLTDGQDQVIKHPGSSIHVPWAGFEHNIIEKGDNQLELRIYTFGDPNKEYVEHTYRILKSGTTMIDEKNMRFMGCFQLVSGRPMLHVFEVY